MASQRLEATFQQLKRQGQIGLIPFLTVGYPDVAATLELVPALVEAGAHIVELGVPFSDPLADGATIQRASFHALGQGVNLNTCLSVAATLRQQGVQVPLVLFGYYNPILNQGLGAFAQEAQAAGVDGVIVPDLPPEEAGPLREECLSRGQDLICLLAPTSTPERIAAACATATGFIYCVSVTGVTGVRERLSSTAFPLVQQVRAVTSLPIAVGFGISQREHVLAVRQHAEAVIVGSALLDVVEGASPKTRIAQIQRFLRDLQGTGQAVAGGASWP